MKKKRALSKNKKNKGFIKKMKRIRALSKNEKNNSFI